MNSCESCGMPLTEALTSTHDPRYCVYCQNQESGDMATYEQVREGSIQAAMKQMGKSHAEAESMADSTLPNLPRWKKELLT